MIRVVQVIARMNVGGPAFELQALQSELENFNIESILITGTCGPEERDFLEDHLVKGEVFVIPQLQRSINPFKDAKAFWKLRNLIKTIDPDIVHTHTSKAGVLGRISVLSLRKRPRLVHTFHGHVFEGYFGSVARSMILGIERFLAKQTDLILCIGSKTQSDLVQLGIGTEAQIKVVPTSMLYVETATRLSARELLGISEDRLVVAYVGRLAEIKRIDRLVDVMKLTNDIPIITWVIIGDGPSRFMLESATQASQLDVRILGWRRDVQQILPGCDLCLLVSDNEGTPLSIVEAAYFGIPTIATNVGSVGDLIRDGENGFIVGRNVGQIASVLRRAATDRELLKKISNQAKLDFRSRFSANASAEEHAKLYHSIK